MNVLYEDEYILVCEKPIGVESQVSSKGKEDMPSLISAYLRENGGDGYVGVVHRLDTSTGGVMIYSKRSEITGKLSKLFGDGEYSKIYLAVIHGQPTENEGELRDLLFHDKQKNKSFIADKSRRGVKEALAEYKLLDTKEIDGEKVSLVEVRLITGRTHQIRVQFASRKMPLLGDGKYGSRDNRAKTALWSHTIEFRHPVTQETIKVTSNPPDIYPFNIFS